MSTWTSERARIASLTRSREPDDPDLIEARRSLGVLRAEEKVRQAVAGVPDLTAEERTRLATIVIGGAR